MRCPHCDSQHTRPLDRRAIGTAAGHWRCLSCCASWPDLHGAAPARPDDLVADVVERVEARRRLDPEALDDIDDAATLDELDGVTVLDLLDEPGSLFDARGDQ